MLERVADEFGRGIRYGEVSGLSTSLVEWLDYFQRYGEAIAGHEVLTLQLFDLEAEADDEGNSVRAERMKGLRETAAALREENIAFLRSVLERLDVGEWSP